jgi:hypothetical protein
MTEHCGLCEKVLEMLFNTPAMQGLGLKTVDIALDQALMELYGSKIPVLLMNGEELSAPISAPQLENWLRTHCK